MRTKDTLSILRSRWMILAIVIVAAAILSTDWYYYTITREHLNAEFGRRLESVASTAALLLAQETELDSNAVNFESIPEKTTAALSSLSERYSISNIMVLREDGTVLYSQNSYLIPPGERYPMWNMDYPAIVKALEGNPTSTDLYRSSDGEYMKAGYAPLSSRGTTAETAVTVEASPAFLEGLAEMRDILALITLISAAGVILFIIFALKATGALIKARESLSRSETLATMGRMAAGIAHEIRNPLFIIRSGAERLKVDHPDEADEIDLYIIEEVDRLDASLTEYLSFSMDRSLEKQNIDLSGILDKSVQLVEKTTQRKDVQISRGYQVPSAPFKGEGKRLLQAFINLLINSCQAVGDKGRIEIGLGREGGKYRIVFTDDGPGIPENSLDKVFEPFYTTKTSGSGLGLSIVRKVIEEHGGTIAIESGKDSETSVIIELPCQEAPESGD